MTPLPKTLIAKSRGCRTAPIAVSIQAPRIELGELLRAVAAYAAGGMQSAGGIIGEPLNRRAQQSAGAVEIVMPALIFGVLVLVLALWALNVMSKVDPKVGARVMKAGGGLLALGFAVFLGLRGEVGYRRPARRVRARSARLDAVRSGADFPTAHAEERRQTSRVRSAYFEMELDHDSGAMRGRIARRPSSRRRRSISSTSKTLVGLLGEIDEESRALLDGLS